MRGWSTQIIYIGKYSVWISSLSILATGVPVRAAISHDWLHNSGGINGLT